VLPFRPGLAPDLLVDVAAPVHLVNSQPVAQAIMRWWEELQYHGKLRLSCLAKACTNKKVHIHATPISSTPVLGEFSQQSG
jgi:hypothetical protein